MSDEPIKQAGRIAMRKEGSTVNVYWALPNTMDGAILLGSIGVAFLNVDYPNNRDRFLSLFQEGMEAFLKDRYGVDAVDHWTISTAPESERGGSA